MKRNALDYARESIKEYTDKSILNPHNKYAVDVITDSERLRWNEHLQNVKVIAYLETILERLPYEPKVEE